VKLKGRNLNKTGNTELYRSGFQGQEEDDELKGDGNSVNYEFRMHDPRLGRFFAIDPLFKSFPHNSSYAFSENVVINAIELEGLEKIDVYNQWTDKNGVFHKKFSHTEYDKGLSENVNKYRTFDAHGKVKHVKMTSKESSKQFVASGGQVETEFMYKAFRGPDQVVVPEFEYSDYHYAPFETGNVQIKGDVQVLGLKISVDIKLCDNGGTESGVYVDGGAKVTYNTDPSAIVKTPSASFFGGFNGYFSEGDPDKISYEMGVKAQYGPYQGSYTSNINGEEKISIGFGFSTSGTKDELKVEPKSEITLFEIK
jgi:RHS repeat-associated protein